MKPLQAQTPGATLRAGSDNAGGRARQRKGRRANLWFFHSHKRNKLLSLCGDVLFAHAVFAEIDPTVATYRWPGELDPADAGSSQRGSTDLHVTFVDGSQQIWRCSRSAHKMSLTASEADGIPILLKTTTDVEARLVRLDNALLLCAALTAAYHYGINPAHQAIRQCLLLCERTTFGDLTSLPGQDPALLQAALVRLHLERAVSIDLDSHLLTRNTVVTRLTSRSAS